MRPCHSLAVLKRDQLSMLAKVCKSRYRPTAEDVNALLESTKHMWTVRPITASDKRDRTAMRIAIRKSLEVLL